MNMPIQRHLKSTQAKVHVISENSVWVCDDFMVIFCTHVPPLNRNAVFIINFTFF